MKEIERAEGNGIKPNLNFCGIGESRWERLGKGNTNIDGLLPSPRPLGILYALLPCYDCSEPV